MLAEQPQTDRDVVAQALAATSETVRYVEQHGVFPLRAGAGLEAALDGLSVEGRPLEALQLRILADFVASIAEAQAALAGRRAASRSCSGWSAVSPPSSRRSRPCGTPST